MDREQVVCLIAITISVLLGFKVRIITNQYLIENTEFGELVQQYRNKLPSVEYFKGAVLDHGYLIFVLESDIGDADLYVSTTSEITTDLKKHNISSYSCGVDVININKYFPRPVYYAVHCASIYKNCTYNLEIYWQSEETEISKVASNIRPVEVKSYAYMDYLTKLLFKELELLI